jgi:hypothetical protein
MFDYKILAYVINSTLLIVHEIDSAYQEEWVLFKIPGGINFFLLLHVPLVLLILYGLLELERGSPTGTIIYVILSMGGLFAYGIHTYLIRKGNPQFKQPVSQAILILILLVSITQLLLLFI